MYEIKFAYGIILAGITDRNHLGELLQKTIGTRVFIALLVSAKLESS